MRTFALPICLMLWVSQAWSQKENTIDCSFETGIYPSTKPTRCSYQKGWDGMMRANWKITKVSRDQKISDPKNGYFALFEARKRSAGYSSRFISPIVSVYDEMCVTFSYVNKGVRDPYPTGRSSLQVYFAPNGRALRKDDKPLWTSTSRTGRNRWAKAQVPISKQSLGEKLRGSVVFVAVRGGSKRAYIAIDNIALKQCRDNKVKSGPVERDGTISMTGAEVDNSSPYNLLRTLAAHRDTRTREFALPPGATYDPANPAILPTFVQPQPKRKRGRSRSRANRRRKGRGRKRPKEIGVVYFTGDQKETASEQPFVPTVIGQERLEVLCDFIEYTQELQRCLRVFFSLLKQHKSESRCSSDYNVLEKCLQTAATKCVPSQEMTRQQVEELVSDTLRTKYKTQEVYCFEEGAFVYPEFSLGSIPLQCSREYFGKLTVCGGSFAGVFNFKHGDPNLCREYFSANECQRRTTATECNFDTRSMLIYGLNLQYQFAHNPFCIDLPFSAWWPSQ